MRDRAPGFWPLAAVFALFVVFLYGPMFTIFVLSFQGPEGGLTFPLRGVLMPLLCFVSGGSGHRWHFANRRHCHSRRARRGCLR